MLEQSILRFTTIMCVIEGEIDLAYVKSEDQVADVFTKALGREKYAWFQDALGVHNMQAHAKLEGKKCESNKRANANL